MLGNAYEDVHIWLDRHAEPGKPELAHREKSHNWNGVIEVVDKHGPQAAIAAIIHILRDKMGIKPWMSDVQKVFVTHEFPEE